MLEPSTITTGLESSPSVHPAAMRHSVRWNEKFMSTKRKNNQEKINFNGERGTSLGGGNCMVWSPFPVLSLIYRETNISCWEIVGVVDIFLGSWVAFCQKNYLNEIYKNVPVSTKLSHRTLVWKPSKYFASKKWNILIVMFLFSLNT